MCLLEVDISVRNLASVARIGMGGRRSPGTRRGLDTRHIEISEREVREADGIDRLTETGCR